MSNPNLFNNNLKETGLNDAYKFYTFSDYIKNGGLSSTFSPICIFCSSNNTYNLMNDGSLKQCNHCRKQFRAQFSAQKS